MGWAFAVLLALLAGGGLYVVVRRDRAALQLTAAALLVALAGYSWQGHPGLAGAPKAAPGHQQRPDSEFARTREDMLGRFDRAWTWLNMADGFQRRGDTESAAKLLEGAVGRHPADVELWIGYANALVAHGGGTLNPAAQLAFQRAASLAPDHPAPRFFFALALAQSGNYDAAERIWRELLASVPPDSQYRGAIEERLQQLQQARAAGQIAR